MKVDISQMFLKSQIFELFLQQLNNLIKHKMNK